MLLDSLKPYLDDLASASPAPGGGAAAAVTIAQGLALLSMVCNLTIGKKKFAEVEGEAKEILEQVSRLRGAALTEAEADMAAFNAVMGAYQMPATNDAEKAAKRESLARATRAAAEPPYRLMELCTRALPLADRLEQIGNPNVLSDVLVGRHLLLAGLASSRVNVEVNLNSLAPEDVFVAEMKARMDAFGKFCAT